MSRLAVALLGALAAVLAAGCGGDDGAEPTSLAGTSWVLVTGVEVPPDVPVTMPTAAFTADAVSGSTGCNRYAGGYVVDGETIDFGAIASTQIACTAPADAIESAFVVALESIEQWEIDDDELVLSAVDGEERLRFKPAETS